MLDKSLMSHFPRSSLCLPKWLRESSVFMFDGEVVEIVQHLQGYQMDGYQRGSVADLERPGHSDRYVAGFAASRRVYEEDWPRLGQKATLSEFIVPKSWDRDSMVRGHQ